MAGSFSVGSAEVEPVNRGYSDRRGYTGTAFLVGGGERAKLNQCKGVFNLYGYVRVIILVEQLRRKKP